MKATTYLLLLFGWATALAQGRLEVIDLRHTTAEQVLPALRPLLEPGGVLTGQRSQLIVRTSARNLAELRRALETLDAPARRLVISVRFEGAGVARDSALGADARVSSRGSRIELRAGETRSAASERVDQRVQVLEGGRARIATGSSQPLQLRDGTVIQDIATGFEVIARLAGDRVLLEIAPQRELAGTVTRGSVQVQRASSIVRARLGEWIELAGIDERSAREQRGILARERSAGSAGRRIWVKVDEVRP
jgi:type II secretory pathway component GspD/PulD (secretin)